MVMVHRRHLAKSGFPKFPDVDISKLGKFPSSVMSSQNALQTVVVIMNWSPHFRSTYNARYC